MSMKITQLKAVTKLSTTQLKSIQAGEENYNFCSDGRTGDISWCTRAD